MLDWVDSELLTFVERFASQRALWKITEYFGRNPHISQTEEAIAQRLGLSIADVGEPLQILCRNGLLEREETQGPPLYRLTSDPALHSMARRFARLCDFAARTSYQALLNPGNGHMAALNA